jgi:hypothetical protein
VLAVVLVLVVVAAVVGVAWQFAQREPSDEVTSRPKASCTQPEAEAASEKVPVPVVPPEKVKVNVYNATSRAGLASDTANALKRRGFRIGKVANDPTKRNVTGEAEVRHGPKGAGAARTVGAQVGDVVDIPDGRRKRVVDLVLGPGFDQLLTPAQAAAALSPTPEPDPTLC